MGDKAGILPTELGMLTPLLWRDGDIVGTTLPPKAGIPPVAGLLGEICHCPGGGGVPKKIKINHFFNYKTRNRKLSNKEESNYDIHKSKYSKKMLILFLHLRLKH